MLTKDSLRTQFAQDWQKHYQVELFVEKGFSRRSCLCGKWFWTLDPERKVCGDSSCEPYGFLGKPVARKKLDYVGMWKAFEKYFTKEGHTSVPRYPVVDRWRPDLYFTIASIQDFQRIDQGKMVFEYPANPLVVPQVCLRFSDIPNVGVTGRHSTCFVMPGQHAFGWPDQGYFKDRCMDLNFGFLNGVLGIPPEELTYVEDVWAMPDFSAFGPSLETMSRGLELVNHVFMQFTRQGEGVGELDTKVIDTGWGHERLVWFSNGTPTSYDVIFGDVVSWLQKQTGVKGSDLFHRYAALAGQLDVEERNTTKVKQQIAHQLGVTLQEIDHEVAPLQALYAIADHTKTLLFAATDGGIPSNVGGGYNLRVLLRRVLSFLKEHGWELDLQKVAELHADRLKKMYPELRGGLPLFQQLVQVERDRYEKSLAKASSLIRRELEKGLTEEALVTLYTSHGVTPETVQQIGGEQVRIPEDFYARVTAHHLAGHKEAEGKALQVDIAGLPATEALYYQDPYLKEMQATVLRSLPAGEGHWVILDRTVFYPEGGGQPADHGLLQAGGRQLPVTDVQKIGGVILHLVPQPLEGEVQGTIDWTRRFRLMVMHDATHILAGACRKVLGPHAWQAGAQKGVDVSRLDIQHFRSFSPEEVAAIEREANNAVQAGLPIEASFLPRGEAEQKWGFTLYQGGASPGRTVRVVDIAGHDTEACGGTHGTNTRHVGMIKVIRTERIQDGVNRLEFAAGEAAVDFLRDMEELYTTVVEALRRGGVDIVHAFSLEDLHAAAAALSVDVRTLPRTVEKFLAEVSPGTVKGAALGDACAHLFEAWKAARKQAERASEEQARGLADDLLKKARDGQLFEVLLKDRKDLLAIASALVQQHPDLTVILANQDGDIVGLSRKEDMGARIRMLCQQAGGSGGGKPGAGQGKAKLSTLLKIMGGE